MRGIRAPQGERKLAGMILDELAGYARIRVERAKERKPMAELEREAFRIAEGEGPHAFPFERALRREGLSFLCEVKKASPSKGVIAEDFPYLEIARDYERAGADCVSCLTEPKWFLGSDDIFREIREAIRLPMIRKDFTVDEYQLYEAKVMGADAALLICALLDAETVARYVRICDRLGMSALVEAHDEREVDLAALAGARIIGINNRNLKDFSVDFRNAERLRERIPKGSLFVAESGVKGEEDVAAIAAMGADGALVGEALMRAADRGGLLRRFRAAAR